MDFEDQQEEEQEQEMSMETSLGGGGGGGLTTTTNTTTKSTKSTTPTRAKYRECLKNHAVGIGGHALDGCGEFMPAGEEGSLDALKCAACNCHRNFHRKEPNSGRHHHQHQHQHHQQFSPLYYRPPPPQQPPAGYLHLTPPPNHRPLALPAAASGGGAYSREDEDVSNPSSSGGGSGGSKKRFRTKFTQEQKDKMLEFAERIGWRLQRHDDVIIEQFCNETGVTRQVLKVWLHNNKHTLGKKP